MPDKVACGEGSAYLITAVTGETNRYISAPKAPPAGR